MLTLVGERPEAGRRLDAVLGERTELGSRSRVAALIKDGAVTVDGVLRPKSYLLSEGQRGRAPGCPWRRRLPLVPQSLPVAILFEDEWLLIVDKPAGMPVHPSRGHAAGTLVNALLGRGAGGRRGVSAGDRPSP